MKSRFVIWIIGQLFCVETNIVRLRNVIILYGIQFYFSVYLRVPYLYLNILELYAEMSLDT